MAASDKSFRGSLLLLQNKTKRDPEAYVDEFRTQLRHFEAVTRSILSGATATASSEVANPQFIAVMQFVCQVSHCFAEDCAGLPDLLIQLLNNCKAALTAEARLAVVNCLLLLRNKNVASAEQTLPVLFDLLEARDKSLRKVILAHVVSDVRRINLPGAKEGSARVNRQIQSFLFKVMADDDPVQARSALVVMVDLYRRELWANERTVEVISKACFSKHTLILRMALHFFMMQMPKFSSVGSDSDSDEQDPGRVISKLKHKMKHKAKTGKRERVLKNKVDALKKRFDEGYRAERDMAKQLVDPVRLLQDPQGFAERLLSKLQKTAERFEVRLLMMSVIARVVSEHELVLLGVFPLLERYLEPTQLHSTSILALASTCVHKMVPPDALESFVRTIADRFVNDRSNQDSITIGINTIREICKRQPLAMNKDLLADLVAYKQRRGERGVIMAARALLQLYREVDPQLLPPKLRGSKAGAPGEVNAPRFGAEAPLSEIPGLEQLFGDGAAPGSEHELSEASDVSDASDLSSEASDAVPQLVPVRHADGIVQDDSDEYDGDDETSDEIDGEFESDEEDDEEFDDEDESEVHSRSLSHDPHVAADAMRPSANGFVLEDDLWVDSSDEDAHAVATRVTSGPKRGPDADPPRKSHRGESQPDVQQDADEDVEICDGDATSSGSGEWVDVSHSDDDSDLMFSDPEGSELSEDPWQDDAAAVAKKRASSSAGVSSVGAASVATMRTLTDAEFAKLRQLQSSGAAQGKMKAKHLEKQERMSRKEALIRDTGVRGQLLEASAIETFTVNKRERDRERKVEEAQRKRLENNPFQARKKKKTKLNTTHREKQKIGKLYQMTKRSARVAEKIKRSVEERRDHAKDMKKKSIKFRIARGWKA